MAENLTQRTIDRLKELAQRRRWTERSIDDMVFELATEGLAVYSILDMDLRHTSMTDEKPRKSYTFEEAAAEMRKGLEKMPGDPSLEGLSDEEFVRTLGRQLTADLERYRPRTEADRKASNKDRGRS